MGKRDFEYVQLTRKPPCMGCDDRAPGCHGQCKRYIAWKAEQAAFQSDMLRTKLQERDMHEVEKDRWRRYRQLLRKDR